MWEIDTSVGLKVCLYKQQYKTQSMFWSFVVIPCKMKENLKNMFQRKTYFALIMVTFNPNGSL